MKTIVLCACCAVLGGVSMQALMQTGAIARPAARSVPASDPVADESASGTAAVVTGIEPVSEAANRDYDGPADRADAIVRLAAADPRAAMEAALSIERHWLRLDTVERVAIAWAERSGDTALAFIERSGELHPEAKSAVRSHVLETWAAVDTARALGYLLTREGQNLFFFDPIAGAAFARALSIRDARALLTAAEALPRGLVRNELRDAALPLVVEQDLAFAVRQASLAAPGPDRKQWLSLIEPAYTQADPEGALEWARGVDPEAPGTFRNVARLVAENFPELGLCELDGRRDPICRD